MVTEKKKKKQLLALTVKRKKSFEKEGSLGRFGNAYGGSLGI